MAPAGGAALRLGRGLGHLHGAAAAVPGRHAGPEDPEGADLDGFRGALEGGGGLGSDGLMPFRDEGHGGDGGVSFFRFVFLGRGGRCHSSATTVRGKLKQTSAS